MLAALALPWRLDINPVAILARNVAFEHLARDGAIGMIVGVTGREPGLHVAR